MSTIAVPNWPPIAIDCKVGYRYGSLSKYVPGTPFVFAEERTRIESPGDGNGVVESTLRSSGGVAGAVGSTPIPRALYLPALSAARFNPDFKAVYDRLRAKGKPAKVALIAVMRKLVILANVLVRNDRIWENRGVVSREVV